MRLKYQPSSAATHSYFHSDAGTAEDEISFHIFFFSFSFFLFPAVGLHVSLRNLIAPGKEHLRIRRGDAALKQGKRVLREGISLRCVACEPGSHMILIKFSSLSVCKPAGCFGVFSSTNIFLPPPPPPHIKIIAENLSNGTVRQHTSPGYYQ